MASAAFSGGTCYPSIGRYDFAELQTGTLEITLTDDTWVTDEGILLAAFGETWTLIPGFDSDVAPAGGFDERFGDWEETAANELTRVSDTVIRFTFEDTGSKVWLTGFQNNETETISGTIPAAAMQTTETNLAVSNTWVINPQATPSAETPSGGGRKWPVYVVADGDLYIARNQRDLEALLRYLEDKEPEVRTQRPTGYKLKFPPKKQLKFVKKKTKRLKFGRS